MQYRLSNVLLLFVLILPGMAWAQSSQALSLEDCINLGLKHNQTLIVNRFETDRSTSQAKSNISLVLPQVGFSLGAGNTGEHSEGIGFGIDTLYTTSGQGAITYISPYLNGEYGDLVWKDSYSMSLKVSQNIWDGGRWWNTLKSARIAQDAADIQLSLYELNTIYQVKVAFYNYLSTLKLLDVYQDNLNTSKYQHQLTLERFRLGAASQNDTLRTRVNIEQSRLQIIDGETDLQAKTRDLNVMLGRDWDTPLTLEVPVWEAVEVPDSKKILAEVLSVNPQLRFLDLKKAVSEYDVKIAKSDYIPSIGLSASYSNLTKDVGDVFDSNTASLSTGVNLSWKLFNGTLTKRSVEQSKISVKIAEENYALAERNLRKDLAQAIDQMSSLKESVDISQLILSASEQDLLLAQEQYKIGSLSILDVLRITASYEDAKSSLIRAQYKLKAAEAGLHQLMGKR
ncbi:MAG: TolC family protein [Candidatus Marinimicrobia bacterium]|nr:TolC family protein [Candidatus Neomarinimicrobiota bacterium]